MAAVETVRRTVEAIARTTLAFAMEPKGIFETVDAIVVETRRGIRDIIRRIRERIRERLPIRRRYMLR